MRSLTATLCLALALLGGLFVGSSALASDQSGHYKVLSEVSCAIVLKPQKSDAAEAAAATAWVAGFLTAYNASANATFNLLGDSDLDAAMAWIKIYCEKNPGDVLSKATIALVKDLYPKRSQTAPRVD
jgi:hypothetical protein